MSVQRPARALSRSQRLVPHGRWCEAAPRRVLAGCALGLAALGGDLGEGGAGIARASALPLPALRQAEQQGASGLRRVGAPAGFAVENVKGPQGKALPLTIRLPQLSAASHTFLMFRGLPEGFTMSAGFRVNERWVVSLRDVRDLKLVPAPDYKGVLGLQVMLMRGRDQEPERRTITVDLTQPAAGSSAVASAAPDAPKAKAKPSAGVDAPTAQPAQPQQRASGSATTPVAPDQVVAQLPSPAIPPIVALPQLAADNPSAPAHSRQIASDDKAMLERADSLFREGDVAAARLLYTRVARKGIAEGAYGMARTFDPAFLRRVPTAGLQPDLAKAQDWYRKAEQLGSAPAKTRLSELGASAR